MAICLNNPGEHSPVPMPQTCNRLQVPASRGRGKPGAGEPSWGNMLSNTGTVIGSYCAAAAMGTLCTQQRPERRGCYVDVGLCVGGVRCHMRDVLLCRAPLQKQLLSGGHRNLMRPAGTEEAACSWASNTPAAAFHMRVCPTRL